MNKCLVSTDAAKALKPAVSTFMPKVQNQPHAHRSKFSETGNLLFVVYIAKLWVSITLKLSNQKLQVVLFIYNI